MASPGRVTQKLLGPSVPPLMIRMLKPSLIAASAFSLSSLFPQEAVTIDGKVYEDVGAVIFTSATLTSSTGRQERSFDYVARRFGLALGRGAGVGDALAGIGQVVEGAAAVAEVLKLARSHGVEMPISEQVEAVVHGGRPPAAAVEALLAREPRDDGV